MQVTADKKELVKKLQAKINAMQGLGKLSERLPETALAPFAGAFPGRVFPSGAIHEFISYEPAEAASTNGFISSLAGKFMKEDGLCLWIGNSRKVFPSGLKYFGLEPDRIVFVTTSKSKDLLWIIEEALKCESLTAVVGEVKELSFTESRRLQLAVEQSGIPCFIHRHQPYRENAVACTTRWKISTLPSMTSDGLPGVGNSCWDVQLLKVRNGRPGYWQISWTNGNFISLPEQDNLNISLTERHTG
ncbi:MAG: Error-prone repair protein ImuA [Bacteroidota bacterium]